MVSNPCFRITSLGKTGRVPLALTTAEVKLDVIDSVSRCRVSLGVFCLLELGAEDVVVGISRCLLDHDLLAVVRNLEDDELGLPPAKTQLVESRDAVRVYGDTVPRLLSAESHSNYLVT